ncbi:MAG TPA: 2-oxoacid:ferredoxin oxidoreductase subunit gamma [Clostridiales bacterium]|nr:2-oxoacid:ferredoxin oxidoreductase subunit gamma [Clostridiales bacterium]
MDTKDVSLIIAGFGGQGILSAGTLIAYAGMLEGRQVTWLPSYGPEMRGGTANCHVIVSRRPIGSPILSKCQVLIVMNAPSLDKFEDMVEPGGMIIADSSLVDRKPARKDVSCFSVPATRISSDMGKLIYANIILMGKLVKETGIISRESFARALEHVLPEKYRKLIPEEMRAFDIGMNS